MTERPNIERARALVDRSRSYGTEPDPATDMLAELVEYTTALEESKRWVPRFIVVDLGCYTCGERPAIVGYYNDADGAHVGAAEATACASLHANSEHRFVVVPTAFRSRYAEVEW